MLVGRVSERQQISRHLAHARIGHGGVLLVVGEPGIGKTTLLADAQAAAIDMRLVQLRGVESERVVAFAALQQLCAPFLDHLGTLPEPQRQALAVALLLEAGRPPDRFAVGTAVLGLLTRVAEGRPLAVFIDDLHLVDESSAQAIAFAGRRLASDPVAVVAAARSTEPFAMADLPRLTVGPLGLDETRALLEPSAAGWDEDRLRRWHAATAGNPLAALELAREPRDLTAAPPDAPVALTGELVAGYSRRILGLTAGCRTLLLLAATDSHDLAALHRACTRAELSLDVLAEAERAGLVRLAGDAVEFAHPLVRAAAYGAAEPGARRWAHRLLAEAVGSGEGDRRAWHAAEAAVGPDERAAALLSDAGEASGRRGAYAVARAQLERAALLSPGDAARGQRLRRAGEQAWLAGESEGASDLLRQALDRADEPRQRSVVRGRLGAIAARCGSLSDARDMLLRAADEAAVADRDEAALLLADAVEACLYLCDAASALAAAERLVSLAADGTLADHTRRVSRLAAGIGYVLGGRADHGARLVRSAVEPGPLHPPGRDPWRFSWTLVGPLFLREGGPSRAAMDTAVAAVRELSALGVLPLLLTLVAKDDATTHRWDAAESSYTEAIRLAAETGHTTDEALALGGLAWLDARRGKADECRDHADRAIEVAAGHDVHLARVWATHALADLAAGAGDADAAVDRYEALVDLLARLQVTDADLWPGPELVECHLQLGHDDRARELAERFAAAARAKAQPWAMARAHRALAVCSSDGAAAQHFDAALSAHARAPEPYESARTQLALGAWLRRARRRSEARGPLREALATFERVGARPWADRAAAELAATGERARRRDVTASTALTPQERQIATTLAAGHTTRETAAALFLSPKTVEYHLRHVYLKLGVRSREELARALADES